MKKARQALPIYVPGHVQEAAKEAVAAAADSSTTIHHQPLREMSFSSHRRQTPSPCSYRQIKKKIR